MRAIVCDKCGKTMLLEDNTPYSYSPVGAYRLVNDKDNVTLDLCEGCANELLEAVRKMKGGDCNE